VSGSSQIAAASVALNNRFPSSSATSSNLHCTFCSLSGSHVLENCFKFKEVSQEAQNKTKAKKCGKGKANAMKEADPQPTESAGAASTHSSLSSPVSDLWNADTGATSHMSLRRKWFKDYCPSQVLICVANHEIVRAVGISSVRFLPVKQGLVLCPVVFTNVLHIPALAENLFSILTVTRKHGFQVMIDYLSLSFICSNQTLFTTSVGDNLIALLDRKTKTQPNSVPSHSAAAALSSIPYEIWHKCLGHLGHDQLARLAKENLVDALTVELPAQSPLYVSCLDGKQKCFPFSHTGTHCSELLELVHLDLHGPLLVSTQSGFRYWISFIDDMSHFRCVYLLSKKSDTFDAFKLFHAWAEKQTGHKLKALRDDKGSKHMSNEWEKYMSECGIEWQHTTRSTPQQNGVAE